MTDLRWPRDVFVCPTCEQMMEAEEAEPAPFYCDGQSMGHDNTYEVGDHPNAVMRRVTVVPLSDEKDSQ